LLFLARFLTTSQRREKTLAPQEFVSRMGRLVPTDQVFDAWTSGDLAKMLAAETTPTNPIDRHFLLLSIVQLAYKQRRVPEMRRLFLKYARQHVSEFERLAGPLREDSDGTLPRVPTFQLLATVLTEDGQLEEAEKVCLLALQQGLHDGTKGGFEARITRIRKKQNMRLSLKTVTRI
jgi:hypothetical protein